MIKQTLISLLLIPALYTAGNGQEIIDFHKDRNSFQDSIIRIRRPQYHRPYQVNPSKMSFNERHKLAGQGVYVPYYGKWHTRHTIYNHKVIYPRVNRPMRISF